MEAKMCHLLFLFTADEGDRTCRPIILLESVQEGISS